MRHKKWMGVFAMLIWAALLLPFFLGAEAAHPATDDFTFALYTHPTWVKTGSILHVLKDALSYSLRTWRDWQGTVTGVIIMTLNPIVFSLGSYGAHAIVLLLANLAAWFVFFRHMLSVRLGLPRGLRRSLYLALSACLLVFLPDMVEGIYWFNGAWFYMGAQAAALLTLVLCDHLSVMQGKRKTAAAAVLACGLLFALGMDNYITAMMTAAALFMMALQRSWAAYCMADAEEKGRQKKAAIRTTLCLLPVGAGLLLSVIAPGNSVRMERDGAHQSGMAWLLSSILWTLRDAAKYIVRFSLKTPLLALLAVMTPMIARGVPADERRARCCPPVWATALGYGLILCAMIIPHMYSSGNAGSGRVVNMYHCYVLTATPIAWTMVILRLKNAVGEKLAGLKMQKALAAAGALLLALCLSLGQIGNYVKLVSDQITGVQDAYIAQFENEYALCMAGGETDDVVLPPWTVQTVTGKSTAFEDPLMWTNEAMASYFGVRSVCVGQ